MELDLVLAALGIIIALCYYILVLQNATKTRQAQLFMNLYNRFHAPEFWDQYAEIIFLSTWEDYTDFWEKYGPAEKENFSHWMSFGTYFTGIAVLVKKNLIDIALVDDLIGDYIIWVWRRLEPLLLEISETDGGNQAYYWLNYLHGQIQKKRKKDKLFKFN